MGDNPYEARGALSNMDIDMADVVPAAGHGGAPGNPQSIIDQQLSAQNDENSTNRSSSNDDPTSTPTQSTSVVGAGPLPMGWGQPAGTSGSSLTEFTKRRNWSRMVLEQLRDMFLILSPELRMQYITVSSELLTGYSPDILQSQFLQDFVHPDDKSMVVREINEAIASRQQFRFFYRFKNKATNHSIFEAFGHPHFNAGTAGTAGPCGGVFMVSRPYPTKNASLLDSFLEHKIENERLMRKIEELKREEREELDAQDQYWAGKERQGSFAQSDGVDARTETDNGTGSMFDGMPPPPKPVQSNVALTKQNLNEALASARPYSINDKMAKYEEATPLEHVEFLTGLRNGERSEGISTGAASPALIKGDVGIVIPDRESRMNSDKKKKLKLADEYVCTDCGTLDSPEWRKGPNGPKTLCNACGLRWAKKEKKRQSVGGSTSAAA